MKQNVKSVLSGALTFAMLMGITGTALAVKEKVSKDLEYADITVSLNGSQVELKDAKGGSVEPFAVDGTTYLPVRAVSDALGLYVDWDQERNQVVLSEKPIPNGEKNTVTFYLVRHGETMFNEKGLAQGWCDAPLTEEGVAQAAALGEGLKEIDFIAAYSSVSERAMDTATAALGGRSTELQLSEDLKEMYFGTLEGAPNAELWADPEHNITVGFDFCGGETWEQLGGRVRRCIDEAAKTYESVGGNVLVASHGMSITGFLRAVCPEDALYIKFMEESGGQLANCSVTVVEYTDGVYTVKAINDTSYLD